MTIRTALIRTAVAVACSGFAATANASIVVTTYKGVITSGYDQTGVFGTANADLTGDAYTAVYTTNDAKGYVYSVPGESSIARGGGTVGTPPVTSVVLTIAGIEQAVIGNYYGYDLSGSSAVCEICSGDVDTYTSSQSFDGSTYTMWQVENKIVGYSELFNPSWDYRAPLKYQVNVDDLSTGGFTLSTFDPNSGNIVFLAYGSFAPTSVTVSGAPEPRAWATLLMGLGGLGATLRRRRRVAVIPG